MTKKNLPVGIDDFKKLINEDYYFVDKSLLIDELLSKKAEVTLLPRPRRFGKTLSMSMIENFFNIEKKEENKNLFNGLAITKTDKMRFMGEYPVIFISFKDIKVDNWETCFSDVQILLKKLYNKHLSVRESLSENEKIDFDKIAFLKPDGDYKGALKNLSGYLYKKYGKKVVILIDEYDTPLITAHYNKYYKEAILFFRNFLSAPLKGNEYLELAVLTGILRVAKESIFSGLNNIDVYTILDKEYDHFGLKENEVEEMLKYYELSYELDEVKRWYNGYTFGDEKVYNPWSLINFVNRNRIGKYWVNTSDNLLIKELLEKNDKKVFEELELLFKGDVIWKSITDTIIFDNLNQMNSIWSLMLLSGYLTFDSIKTSPLTHITTYSLRIPNEEIRSFFIDTFINSYTDGSSEEYGYIMEDLFSGRMESFVKRFKKMYFSAISYYDSGDNEKYYHHFMLGFFLTLGDKYTVTSNRESGYGRYDIALEPKDKKNYGIIFEFKVATEDNLKEKAKEAIEQINEKKYDEAMRRNGVEKVIKVGMAFYKKDVDILTVID